MTSSQPIVALKRDVVVLKFGSSVLDGAAGLKLAAAEVRNWVEKDVSVVAVVSALGKTTNRLLDTIHEITDSPCQHASAAVLGAGEDAAAAFLAVALRDQNVRCVLARQETFRIITKGDRLDADPTMIDVQWFEDQFIETGVVIVPGFVGRCEEGEPSLLGRGGSDLSALFLAWHLNAIECRLVKDVDGVFAWDPNDHRQPPPRKLRNLTWVETARLADGLVQLKAIRYAEARQLPFTVAALGGCGTVVGACGLNLHGGGEAR